MPRLGRPTTANQSIGSFPWYTELLRLWSWLTLSKSNHRLPWAAVPAWSPTPRCPHAHPLTLQHHTHAPQPPQARLRADNTTCFVSAAVQCLRHAAELPLLLVPTLEADMLAARAEQATSSSAPSAVPLAPAAPLGSSAPATPSGSPHSLQQAHPPAPQGQDSADVASVAQQRDSDPAGDSPQAPSTPQTSTPRSSAFSAPADSARPSTEGLEDRGSGPDAQLRHSGIAPLLPDDSPQTTPGRQGAAGSGPASGPPPIGPRPSIKVPGTCCPTLQPSGWSPAVRG